MGNCAIWLYKAHIFLECITHTDCPGGGNDYVCNSNKCECPHPKVLNSDNCVGMLLFEKNISQKLKVLLLIASNISYHHIKALD